MALPSQGALSANIIANEVGGGSVTPLKLGGNTTPTTDSLIYWYRSGNVNTSGVDQSAPFKYSDFYGQEALYRCTTYTAAGSTGTATVVIYPGIPTDVSVPPNSSRQYCTRVNYDGSLAATNVSGLTIVTGSSCNGGISVGNSSTSAFVDYGRNGVRLYTSFNIDGSGTSVNWNTDDVGGTYTGTFWANPNNNTTDGRLNQTGLWSGSQTYIGSGSLSFVIPVATSKTYYIGIGCDNYAAIYVDNVLRVAQTANISDVDNFRYWNIYPITMSAGPRLVRIIGVNFGSVGSMGTEIYDNTFTEISSSIASSPNGSSTPSGLNIIFSSKDYRGAGVIGAAFDNQAIQCPITTTTTSTTTTTTTTPTPTTTTSTTTTTTTPTPTTTTTTTTSTTTTTTTLPCFESIAEASQIDIDNSDDGNVYFEYLDCTGAPGLVVRATTVPSSPICVRSEGRVYIIVGGIESVTTNSFWTPTFNGCI